MKRLLFCILVLPVFLAIGACDDKPPDYDFNGTWMMTSSVSSNSTGGFLQTETIVITQSGSEISISRGSFPGVSWTGTCDPEVGSFRIDQAAGSNRYIWIGQGEAETAMDGVWAVYGPGGESALTGSWAASLLNR